MIMLFIGREHEIRELKKRHNSQKAELFIVYGRRRIGKSELLLQFSSQHPSIYYEASLQEEPLNLIDFKQETMAAFPNDPVFSSVNFHDWASALTLLSERAKDKRLLVILDEFPYLCKVNPALPSILQRFWDNVGRHTKIFLILCGSSISFMEHEIFGKRSPLFGRRTGQLKLEGLTPNEASLFSRGWNEKDRLISYGIFGNIPAYLNLIDTNRNLASLLVELAFEPTGFLYGEIPFILQQKLRELTRYNSVLRAIAGGKTKIGEIAAVSGCENTAVATKYLSTLIALGIVERAAPFFARAPEKSRNNRYFISDLFTRFWYRFVLPNHTAIRSKTGKAVVEEAVMPYLDDFMGDAFQTLCRDYLVYDWAVANKLYIKRSGCHWADSFDIDLCAEVGDGSFILGECKWGELINLGHLEKLKLRSKPLVGESKVRFAFFSGKGKFSKELKEISKAGDVLLFGPKDILTM